MEILVIFSLILLNGFFALSEIALVSSKAARLEHLRKQGNSGAKRALLLLQNPDRFLSAIQVGITLIGIVTGMYGGISLADNLTPVFTQIEWLKDYAHEAALFVIVLLITYVSIVLGELVPKTFAISNPEKIACKVASPVHYFSLLFYPFVKLLSGSTVFINKLLGIKMRDDKITEREIRQLLKNASVEGVIEKDQSDFHEKLFHFSDKRAKHFMTHRTEVEWIDISMAPDKINEMLIGLSHSKIIGCNGSLDDFTGYFYQREFFKRQYSGSGFDLAEIMVKPVIIPETAHSQAILNILRQPGNQLCFVVNEYGGFEGIITLHDVIESIMGQFPSNDMDISSEIFKREDGSFLIGGDSPVEILSDLIEDFTIDFDDVDYSTVAGFLIENLNQIPRIGDKFRFKNHTFEIVDMDGNRIDKVLIYGNHNSRSLTESS